MQNRPVIRLTNDLVCLYLYMQRCIACKISQTVSLEATGLTGNLYPIANSVKSLFGKSLSNESRGVASFIAHKLSSLILSSCQCTINFVFVSNTRLYLGSTQDFTDTMAEADGKSTVLNGKTSQFIY